MLHSHHQHFLFSTLPVPLSLTHHHHHHYNPSPSLHFVHRTITKTTSVSAVPPDAWLAQLTTQDLLGAIEQLPFPISSLSHITDDSSSSSSAVQVASTLLLSAAIFAFSFRSVRRRVKRAKEMKFRSSGVNKSLDSLKAMKSSSIKAKKSPPSPDQALLGAVIAGVIAVFLYRFTTSIEASLARQALSDNFSVRQITITIRTIINGLCYLATFVYGINSVGLLLYSGQLALDIVGGSTIKESASKGLSNASVENLTNNNQLNSSNEDQSSNNSL